MSVRAFSSYDWFTISLVLVLIVLVLLKFINTGKYTLLAKLAYSNDYLSLKDKESRFFTLFEYLVIFLAHLIAAQFVYFIVKDMSYVSSFNIYPFFKLLIIFTLLSLLSLLKYQLEKLVNKCLTDSDMLSYYQFYKQILWSYSIFLGLPFLVFIIYNPSGSLTILYISFGFMAVFYLFKMLFLLYKNRSLLIRNWYYLILYLCALEIAPYFFLYKIFGVS